MMAEFNTVTSSYLKYSTVVGYFLQADPDTDPHEFDFVRSGFCALDQGTMVWGKTRGIKTKNGRAR
jgi:hypothetical protein